jgi:glycosyltransferase involved in cell wall biosynthesis
MGLLARLSSRRSRSVTRVSATAPAAGRALLSYLREGAAWPMDDPRFAGHTNRWEARQIAVTLAGLGFDVDVVDFNDAAFVAEPVYDVVMGLDADLLRHARSSEAPRRLIHLTGSYAAFNNAAEEQRLADLWARRGVRCLPRRLVADPEGAAAALEVAEAASLVGNAWVRDTYPSQLRDRVTCIPVTGSVLPARLADRPLDPPEREFLWFFGGGAVHKGLDLVLEAFAAAPGLVLNIVGELGAEPDFLAAYADEFALPNIRAHGYLTPDDPRFDAIVRRCFAFVAPSCAEATSTACVTLLQLGLYPIVSRQTGVDLASGCGTYLESCTPAEIEAAIRAVHAFSPLDLVEQVRRTRDDARRDHSRDAFASAMHAHLARLLCTA